MIHPAQLASKLGHLLLSPRSAPRPPAAAEQKTTPGQPVQRDTVEISAEARRLLAAQVVAPAQATSASQAVNGQQGTVPSPAGAAPRAVTGESEPGTAAGASEATSIAGTESSAASQAAGTEELSQDDQAEVTDLERQDREVRTHEQAHKAAGGQYAGAISYSYTTGPDGKRYASGGSVPIDSSPVEGDSRATIKKMQQVIAAANAPADPSGADRQVASSAARELRKAQQQSLEETSAQQEDTGAASSEAASSESTSSKSTASATTTTANEPQPNRTSSGIQPPPSSANTGGTPTPVRSVGVRLDTFA